MKAKNEGKAHVFKALYRRLRAVDRPRIKDSSAVIPVEPCAVRGISTSSIAEIQIAISVDVAEHAIIKGKHLMMQAGTSIR